MKSIKLTIILVFSFLLIQAQNIIPFGTGTSDTIRSTYGTIRIVYVDTISNLLYAAGSFEFAGGKQSYCIAYWDGSDWFPMGTGVLDTLNVGTSLDNVYEVIRYNNEIYIAGNFQNISGKGIAGIARWDGTEWKHVGDSIRFNNKTYPVVDNMEILHNELYIVGRFDSIGKIPCKGVAKWDGTNWTDISNNFPAITTCSYDGLFGIKAYNNEIYIAGNMNCGPGHEEMLLKRVGSNWVQVGPFINADATINELSVFQNKLYIGGYFFTQGGNADNSLVYLENNTFQPTAGGLLPSNVWDTFEYKNELYVCGQINYAGFQPINRIAKWDGFQWLNTGLSIEYSSFDGTLQSMTEYNGKLVVAGGFSSINGTPANNIAMIDFTTGLYQENLQNKRLKVYPNPVRETLNIKIDEIEQKGKVKLFNQLGQKVYEQVYGSLQTINMANFVKGIYIIEVETNQGVLRQKVVLE